MNFSGKTSLSKRLASSVMEAEFHQACEATSRSDNHFFIHRKKASARLSVPKKERGRERRGM